MEWIAVIGRWRRRQQYRQRWWKRLMRITYNDTIPLSLSDLLSVQAEKVWALMKRERDDGDLGHGISSTLQSRTPTVARRLHADPPGLDREGRDPYMPTARPGPLSAPQTVYHSLSAGTHSLLSRPSSTCALPRCLMAPPLWAIEGEHVQRGASSYPRVGCGSA
jgi:hypothetical protein